jgi:hypothetical protein
MARAVKHYLSYQHNVQRFFKDFKDAYDGVLIPLSIAISFPTGTYGFVRALCAKDKDKQYAIDPRTPLFQKAWDRTKVRPPHVKMAEVLGEPFTTKGLDSRIEAADFADAATIDRIAKSCVDFQVKFRTREEDSRKLAKYKKLLGVEELGHLCEPLFIIPPYFQFSEIDDAWFAVSTRFTAATLALKPSVPVHPVIHFDAWSAIPDWAHFASEQSKLGVKALWVYPNNFHEHVADKGSLTEYRNAVSALTAANIRVGTLHGGYFAILLSQFGLQSFCNGVGYGEWRDSGYHRGGTADIRIYVPKLHRFLGAPLVQSLIDRDPDHFASDSELLASCIAAGRPVTEVELAEANEHFLECRQAELEFVGTKGLKPALEEITETVGRLKEFPKLEQEEYIPSLSRWSEVLGGE